MKTRLLVSVRDAGEAEAALDGGAALIDVKEPARGPLGRADAAVLAAVLREVAGRAPVSAAADELTLCPPPPPAGLAFVKFGLAGWRGRDWPDAWRRVRARLPAGCAPVAVAYADWERADAPPPAEVAAAAAAESFGAFLIDTFAKDGSTLPDWLPPAEIAALTRRCQSAGVPVALAGSLGPVQFLRLHEVGPDWFAVRGAACAGGRGGRVEAGRVRALVALLRGDRPLR